MMHKTNDLRRPSRRVSISLSALLGERRQQRALEKTAASSSPPKKQQEVESRILPPFALSLSKCEESSGSREIVGEDDGGAALQVSEVRADTSNASNAPETIAHSAEKSSQTEHAPIDFAHDTWETTESNQTETRNKSPKSVAAQTETVVVEEPPHSPSLQGPPRENVGNEKSIDLKHEFAEKPIDDLSRSFEGIETGVDDAGEKAEVTASDFIAPIVQGSLSPPPPPPPPSPPLKISQSPIPLSKLGRTETLDQILKNREMRINSTRVYGHISRATKDRPLAAHSSTPERFEKNSNFGSPVVKSAMDRSGELISLLDSLLAEEEETEVESRDSIEHVNIDAEIERILQNRARRQQSIPAHKDVAKEETPFATQNRRRTDMLSPGSTYNRSNDDYMNLSIITAGRSHEPPPTSPVISSSLLSTPSQTANTAPHSLPPLPPQPAEFLDTQCSNSNAYIEDLVEKHRRGGMSINNNNLSQYQLKRAFPILGLQDGDYLSSLQELVDPLLKGVVLNLLTPRQETNCTLWRSYRCTFWLSADLCDLQWYEHATGNGGVVPVEKILKVHRISNKNGRTFLTTETGTIQFNKILELHVNTSDDELVVIRLAANSTKDQESWYSGLNYCRSVLSFVAIKRRMAASVGIQ